MTPQLVSPSNAGDPRCDTQAAVGHGQDRSDDFCLGPELVDHVRARLAAYHMVDKALVDHNVAEELAKLAPTSAQSRWCRNADANNLIDLDRVDALGALVTRREMPLDELITLLRGQTHADPRPNKRIHPAVLHELYGGYQHRNLMISMATHGFDPHFETQVPRQDTQPPNHKSASENLAAVQKFLAEGQKAGTMLLLPDHVLGLWREAGYNIHVSPIGVVPKNGEDTAKSGRVITDLSFPKGDGVNDQTRKTDLPSISWRPVTDLAKQITKLAVESGWSPSAPENSTIYMMAGDVSAAFRHLSGHRDSVRFFGIHVPELKVLGLDMSAPFGWTGSPIYYGVMGNGISWLVGRESPHTLNPHLSRDDKPFFAYEWVDDHILVELDTPRRLESANTALRLAMLSTLGHDCMNAKKFTTWSREHRALGLQWDLCNCTVSIPADKIQKALGRITTLAASKTITKLQLQQAVGSLRHVCVCIPAARPYYQRLQSACNALPPAFRRQTPPGVLLDASWFLCILEHGHLQSIPTSIFGHCAAPDVHIFADACDTGLAVLDASQRCYIRVDFDAAELKLIDVFKDATAKRAPNQSGRNTAIIDGFSINVREFLSVILAVSAWGHRWSLPAKTTHVRFWLDNKAAVTWTNKLASPNAMGQQICRSLGLFIAKYNLHLSAVHLPGSDNIMADFGSRAAGDEKARSTWNTFVKNWSNTEIPACNRRPYLSTNPSSVRWPRVPSNDTMQHGRSGPLGAIHTNCHTNSQPTLSSNQTCYSHGAGTCSTGPTAHSAQPLSALSWAASIGIIKSASDGQWPSMPATSSGSKDSVGQGHQKSTENPSRPRFYTTCGEKPTSTTTTTGLPGGLRSWVGSSAFGVRSIWKPESPTTTYDAATCASRTPGDSPASSGQTSTMLPFISGRPRPTKLGEDANARYRDPAFSGCAPSRPPGGCFRTLWQPVNPQTPRCAAFIDQGNQACTSRSHSSPSRSNWSPARRDGTRSASPHTHSARAEQLRCSLGAQVTSPSSCRGDGSATPTRSIRALTPRSSLPSPPRWSNNTYQVPSPNMGEPPRSTLELRDANTMSCHPPNAEGKVMGLGREASGPRFLAKARKVGPAVQGGFEPAAKRCSRKIRTRLRYENIRIGGEAPMSR